MPEHTYPLNFAADGPIGLSVRQQSGDIVCTAAETTEVSVDLRPSGPNGDDLVERTKVDYRSDELRIDVPKSLSGFGRSSSVDVLVTVPIGSRVDLESGAGDIKLDGELGAVSAKAGSGDIVVDRCSDVRLRTGSGDVSVRECESIVARTGSGDIRLDRAHGPAELQSGSGDIQVVESIARGRIESASGDVGVGTVDGQVELTTASGDVRVHKAVEGEIQAKSASGDVTIGITGGTTARLDVSTVAGTVRSELSEADAPAATDRKLFLAARTVSGSITLHRTS